MDDCALYNGKKVDLRKKMTEIVEGMNKVNGFVGLVSIPRYKTPLDISKLPKATTLQDFNSKAKSNEVSPFFEKTGFRDPFMIAYSSGTSGMPKCIVHSIGGALLSSAKEGLLHKSETSDSVILQYTTTGWIMYFSAIMGLFAGARVILYDGSPFQPDITIFMKIMAEQQVTTLGTSPRWMAEVQKNNIVPKDLVDLSRLRMVTSTGMVLGDRQFEWFYDIAFPKQVHLGNLSGGTDIVSMKAIL
jgi:acetoacetyl-CoA synthetase